MHLTQFTCTGFRALNAVCFEPARGINVVRGDNAQGKTSLLEAMLFAATARSHRTNIETDLVAQGQDQFHLRACATRRDRDIVLEANWWQGMKRFKVNGVAQTRVSDILGKINVVLFSPEDIVLIKGTAAHRRRFLDMELSQISGPYLNALQQYRQALRQRNELLRADRPAPDLLDVWDAQLVQHGEVIVREREGFLAQLALFAAEAYCRVADGEAMALAYQPDVGTSESLAAVLAKSRDSDLRRRQTTHGPHRDDIEIAIAGQPARNFASQGQQKTAALALRLAELALVRKRAGEYPILMLDEVLSELDDSRAGQLFNAIDEGVQCVVTATTLIKHPALTRQGYTHFHIERGILERA